MRPRSLRHRCHKIDLNRDPATSDIRTVPGLGRALNPSDDGYSSMVLAWRPHSLGMGWSRLS